MYDKLVFICFLTASLSHPKYRDCFSTDIYTAGNDSGQENGEVSTFGVLCWEGSLDNTFNDAPSDKRFSTTVNVPSSPEDFGAYREISHDGSFACSWKFDAQNEDDVGGDGRPYVEMHKQYNTDSPQEGIKDAIGVEEILSTATSLLP